jgi:hypothetical protein
VVGLGGDRVAEALDRARGSAYHDAPIISPRGSGENLGMIGPHHQRVLDGLVLGDGKGHRRDMASWSSVPCPAQIEGARLPTMDRSFVSAGDALP